MMGYVMWKVETYEMLVWSEIRSGSWGNESLLLWGFF